MATYTRYENIERFLKQGTNEMESIDRGRLSIWEYREVRMITRYSVQNTSNLCKCSTVNVCRQVGLEKGPDCRVGFGFSVTGNRVRALAAGGLAARDGRLRVGDMLTHVNNVDVIDDVEHNYLTTIARWDQK